MDEKNTGKFQGAVKVLMEFQEKKGKKLWKIPGGSATENGYPQQEEYGLYISEKAHCASNIWLKNKESFKNKQKIETHLLIRSEYQWNLYQP